MFHDMLYPAIMQAMIPRHPCNWVLGWDVVLLQSSVVFVSSRDCFAAIHGGLVPVPVRPRPSITQMQHRMPGPVARASAHAVGFMCRNCNNIFDSRRSIECHRSHITSQGTPCADPNSNKSFSFTGRADTSTRIIREHAGTLGAFSNCCSRCVLRALLQLFWCFPGEIM